MRMGYEARIEYTPLRGEQNGRLDLLLDNDGKKRSEIGRVRVKVKEDLPSAIALTVRSYYRGRNVTNLSFTVTDKQGEVLSKGVINPTGR